MSAAPVPLERAALLLLDLQNDFLDPNGAYGRAGQTSPALAALPGKLAPLAKSARQTRIPVISSHFTLVPGPDGEPIISPHLKELRPFLTRGDFAPGSWGHALVEPLAPAGVQIEKVAYSAFYMTRLEWVLRKLDIDHVVVAGLVTNGGVASTVRDAHVRDIAVTLLEDGCAAMTADLHETAIAALRPVARIATIADIIGALDGRTGQKPVLKPTNGKTPR
ncbi:MAG: cysteine hydrolase family protein [Beijerinckiaceae bacterium]